MMKKMFSSSLAKMLVWLAPLFLWHTTAQAQGMHFSQYYNAPLLLNPANTALVPDADFRFGLNYRNQWSSIPVPYRTVSAYTDYSLLRNQFETNWLGIGLAFFNDQAGVGRLSLNKIDLSLAYHVQMGDYVMLSVGGNAGYGMRAVDMSRFSYNVQWNGFTFNTDLPSQEVAGMQRTNYFDAGAGLNFAFFPNENVYIKLGAAMAHLNQPTETLINGSNQMGMRPTGNLDMLFKLGDQVIVNPSVYYTQQKSAKEIVAGTMLSYLMSSTEEQAMLYLGAYYRVKEAIVPMVGLSFSGTKLMVSYDVTLSDLSMYNGKQGALEIALNYQGFYGEGGKSRMTYNCPRF